MNILGIDPGLYGALALYDIERDVLETWDVPTLNLGTAKARKMVVDEIALANLVDGISTLIDEVWLERVGVRPGEGAVGAFSFGRTYGLIRGICAAHFLRVNDVTPQSWKAALKVTGDKDQSRARASQLWPRYATQWPLKKHDGRAESALIARYGALRPRAI